MDFVKNILNLTNYFSAQNLRLLRMQWPQASINETSLIYLLAENIENSQQKLREDLITFLLWINLHKIWYFSIQKLFPPTPLTNLFWFFEGFTF